MAGQDSVIGMENPFALFPVVVWEMILDRVGHSETVYSVLQIYPQLDKAFQKKKHKWLLGKILPFITTWKNFLEEEELLKCRLGCQNWLKQVDNFLENQQPQLRPYHPSLQSEDQFILNSKAQFGEQDEDLDSEKKMKGYFGGVSFIFIGGEEDAVSFLQEFLEQMGSLPEERNPFPARSLSVKILRHAMGWTDYEQVVTFLHGVKQVLEKFGQHVWDYSIDFMEQSFPKHIRDHTRDWLIRSFGLLPNLRSFRAPGILQQRELGGTGSAPINLPFLESISVSKSGPSGLVFPLMSGATSLRRLELEFNEWWDNYPSLLSTVTELKIGMIEINTDEACAHFKDFMLSLDAPQLVKLELEFTMKIKPVINSLPFCIEDDIFPWIKRFPFLKYAAFGSLYSKPFLSEKGTLLPERDSLRSLQFLTIRDSSALSYDFLRCLPSLQHLRIYMDASPRAVDLSDEKVVKIREQIENRTMHTSNIWELLPNLRSVSILNRLYRRQYVCDREKVNYFKEHPDYQGLGVSWDSDGVDGRREPDGLKESVGMLLYLRDCVPGSGMNLLLGGDGIDEED